MVILGVVRLAGIEPGQSRWSRVVKNIEVDILYYIENTE